MISNVGLSFTGGKDCILALHHIKEKWYTVVISTEQVRHRGIQDGV